MAHGLRRCASGGLYTISHASTTRLYEWICSYLSKCAHGHQISRFMLHNVNKLRSNERLTTIMPIMTNNGQMQSLVF